MKLVDRQNIFFLIVLLGFVLGILYTNFFASDYLAMTGVFSGYYLQEFASKEWELAEYLPRLLWIRIAPMMGLLMVAYSRLHKVGVVMFLIWTGFLWGIYMSIGVIQLGIVGVVFCVLGMFPQMLFYVPAYLIILIFAFKYPDSQWSVLKIGVVMMCMVSGIGVECQLNPQILKWFIELI